MHQNNKVEQAADIAFEPSQLIEYGEASEQTRNSTQQNTGTDGSSYNS